MRVQFNETVRSACIVRIGDVDILQDNKSIKLKSKRIVFKSRGQILAACKRSTYNMETEIPSPIVVNGWYIDSDRHLYYENTKYHIRRTSPIISVEGNMITTTNRTKYQLGEMDILVRRRLNNYHNTKTINEKIINDVIDAVKEVYPSLCIKLK